MTQPKSEVTIPVHYGQRIVDLHIPEKNLAFELKANQFPLPANEAEEIRRGIMEPVGTGRLRDIVPQNEKVVIM